MDMRIKAHEISISFDLPPFVCSVLVGRSVQVFPPGETRKPSSLETLWFFRQFAASDKFRRRPLIDGKLANCDEIGWMTISFSSFFFALFCLPWLWPSGLEAHLEQPQMDSELNLKTSKTFPLLHNKGRITDGWRDQSWVRSVSHCEKCESPWHKSYFLA